jgi:hypothetical protein
MCPNLAKSSYGWLPLQLHHKIEKENPACSAPQLETPDHLAVDEPYLNLVTYPVNPKIQLHTINKTTCLSW